MRSKEIRGAVWEKSGGCCAYCGEQLNPFLSFTIDHIVPLLRGGLDDIENLTASCLGCNSSKGSKSVTRWEDIEWTAGMEDHEWMTVDDVAKRLKVHPQSVRRWIKSGELIASQLGDKAGYRIKNSDLEAFMKQRQRNSNSSRM